jgi:hypothetical protein
MGPLRLHEGNHECSRSSGKPRLPRLLRQRVHWKNLSCVPAEVPMAFFKLGRECSDCSVVEDPATLKARIEFQQLSDNRPCFLHATGQGQRYGLTDAAH